MRHLYGQFPENGSGERFRIVGSEQMGEWVKTFAGLYTPAPPEGAPSWEELAEAVLRWAEARREVPDTGPGPETGHAARARFHGTSLRLYQLADRLRPLLPKGE